MPGLLVYYARRKSVFRDDRTGPIEAIDQRGLHRLDKRLEADVGANEPVDRRQLVDVLAVVPGSTIFGLHEQAGHMDAEDIEAVLDATADKQAVEVKRVGVNCRRQASEGEFGGARPMRAGVTAVDIRENIRGHQIAEPQAGGVVVLILDRASDLRKRVLNGAPQAAELTVAEHTNNPGVVELPIVASTHCTEPAIAALALPDAECCAYACDPIKGIGIPDTATGAAKDVETSPTRRHRNRRSFDIGAGGQISRSCRTGECRQRGHSDQELLHHQFLKFIRDRTRPRDSSVPVLVANITGSFRKAVAAQAQSPENDRVPR